MKAVIYARVSSEKQAEKDLSISAQLKAVRKYAKDRGWEIVREFVDEAESARSTDPPPFRRWSPLPSRGISRECQVICAFAHVLVVSAYVRIDPFRVQNGQLMKYLSPVGDPHGPFLHHVLCDEIEHFCQ
jgi:hypothetical protein